MSQIVAGKLAFVTGAGSGIGREVCRSLAREGAKVVVSDRFIDKAQETLSLLQGAGHRTLQVEVTDQKNIETAFQTIRDYYSKPPTIIVNCAGIRRDNFILKLTESDFDNVIDINLKGSFLVMQTAAKALIEADIADGSSIINISSINGKTGNIGQSNYAASKAGVIAMTKTAAMEFGKFGIRVNSIAPGFIDTALTSTVSDNVKQMFINRVPLRRMGQPQEVAEVVVFLASNKSSYVNGTSIDVTGGMQ